MKQVKIGLIGANWMGSFHSIGFTNVRQAYHDVQPIFEIVADVNEKAAQLAADRFGYQKVTTDWHDVVNDPEGRQAHFVREADGKHPDRGQSHGRCH